MIVQKQLKNDLSTVKEELNLMINTPFYELNDIFAELKNSQGKMIRAQFCIICSKIFEKNPKNINQLAALIELIHFATLVHDDIIDEAEFRRGKQSIQSKFGKDIAVYAGDYLFTECFAKLNELFYDQTDIINANIQTMKAILAGELLQKQTRYNIKQSIFEKYQIMNKKTGALFALACYEGSFLGNANEKMQSLCGQIGLKIGLIFQILDDILDLHQNSQKDFKSSQHDFLDGVYTLPLLLVYPLNPEFFDTYLTSKMTIADNKLVINKVIELGGIELAKQEIEKLILETYQLIELLPRNDWTLLLKELCKKISNQNY